MRNWSKLKILFFSFLNDEIQLIFARQTILQLNKTVDPEPNLIYEKSRTHVQESILNFWNFFKKKCASLSSRNSITSAHLKRLEENVRQYKM